MKGGRGIILAFRLIPTGLLSFFFGSLTRIPIPGGLMARIIRWYSGKFGIIDEYVTPPGGFRTFNEFFTRELKPGARKQAQKDGGLLSPVDARIDQYGHTEDGTLIQAKGITYTVDRLIPSELAAPFRGGSFITLYLSPGDYHRIHSPVSGTVTGYYYIPGALFTVQDFMVRGLPGLFVKNERLISYIETTRGMVAVCKVGAMNVGRISLSYPVPGGKPVISNRVFKRRLQVLFSGHDRVAVKAGDELGRFNLGSTVIVLTERRINFEKLNIGGKTRLGDLLGTFSGKKK